MLRETCVAIQKPNRHCGIPHESVESWQSTHSSQGKSTHLTHPLAPSAREGEQENCHALESPLPQHEGI
ncbi:hypothetical protein [Helicobacter macacae]|uniref:hypothetical protein n=1 Tax=Helicobacter macacae TaxID=398626 RepID=UPI0011DCB2B2|nr:hypothetical protein [Helicobacter macacae]